MRRSASVLLLVVAAAAAVHAQAVVQPRLQAAGAAFRIVRIAGDLEYPWALALLPGGRYLVSERPGRLVLVQPDGTRQNVNGLPPVRAAGQGGLLDLALHPDFARTSLVFWTFAAAGPGGASTALARGRLDGLALRDVKVLWTMPRRTATTVHFGSRIRFGADGKIYLTTGERGEQDRAREPGDAAGKVIRLNEDGTIPADNPFAGRAGYLPEIYSLGHRNAQGLAVRPGSGQLWLTEHGPGGRPRWHPRAPPRRARGFRRARLPADRRGARRTVPPGAGRAVGPRPRQTGVTDRCTGWPRPRLSVSLSHADQVPAGDLGNDAAHPR